MFQIIQDRSIKLEVRMELLLEFAEEIQLCVEEERYFDVDAVIEETVDFQDISRQDPAFPAGSKPPVYPCSGGCCDGCRWV